jgi:hypothetical protein
MVQDSLAVGLARLLGLLGLLGAVLPLRPAAAAPTPAASEARDAPDAPDAPDASSDVTPAPGRQTDDADADTAADAVAAVAAADAALKRVLASGCRDGLADVYRLIGNHAAPWAETVLRVCGEILRRAPQPRAPQPRAPQRRARVGEAPAARAKLRDTDGRGQLVFLSGLYGAWLGIATDVLSGMGDSRALVVPPVLGMAAGLTVSLKLTSGRHVTSGEAWTIITGLDYGSINGALWAGGLGLGTKAIVGTSVATSFAAGAAGLAVADARSPSAGQIELCRSGLLWGAVAGFLGVTALAPDPGASGRATALATALAMDVGFGIGLGVARVTDVSRTRALIIDAGAFGGTLFGLGVVWLAVGQSAGHGNALAAGGLVGLAGGIVFAALATRNLDASDSTVAAGSSDATFPALVSRDAGGRWRAGTPAPTPVLDPTGTRLAGAALSAVGGLF